MIDARDKVVVVGGGIGGLSTALALTKVRLDVMILVCDLLGCRSRFLLLF